MVQRAVDALADRLVGDVPQYYVDFIRQDVGREMMQSFEKQGTSLQEWLLNNNGKADEIKENVTQEAIRRAREMQARARANESENAPPPRPPEPSPEAEPLPPASAAAPASPEARGSGSPEPEHGASVPGIGGALDFITKDTERSLILILLLILTEEKADNALLFAMMYLLL